MRIIRPASRLLALLLIHPALAESVRDNRPPDSEPQVHQPYPAGHPLRVGLSAPLAHARPAFRHPAGPPQNIGRWPSANHSSAADPFAGPLPKPPSSPFIVSGPRPSPPPLPYQQVLQFQRIEVLPTNTHSGSGAPSLHHRRAGALHRRDNGPTQTWPGTDTVYATQTVFISQAAPATTVYVSNGQIITPFPPPNASPTPYVVTNNNNVPVWVSPSGNPNIVVATVTAMSSAHRYVWDDFYTTHAAWWTMMVGINVMICFFTSLGFGFVSLGL